MVDFFSTFFSADRGLSFHFVDGVSLPRIFLAERRSLEAPVSLVEVRAALFSMRGPGPDGIQPIFYLRHWHIVGPTVLPFVHDAFCNGFIS